MARAYQGSIVSSRSQSDAAFDVWLFGAVMFLLLLGLVMVYSASIAMGSGELALNLKAPVKHGVHVAIGVTMMLWVWRKADLYWVQRLSPIILAGVLVLMVLVLIPGVGMEINASKRWLGAGSLNVQPAEMLKIAALLAVSAYFARHHHKLHAVKYSIAYPAAFLVLIGALLALQPDFGSLLVIVALVAGLMIMAGVPVKYLLLCGVLAATVLVALAFSENYRIVRMMTYLDPWATPFGAGFQLTQALMAIGRGGWLGVGLGNSLQKLNYLPHADNDFLIAIIAEELGAVGVMCVLAAFCTLIWRAYSIAKQARFVMDRFGSLIALGAGLMMTINAAIHVGVNTGLLPTKGLNLPLMSAGGSSMLVSLIAVGFLLAVDKQNRRSSRRRR